MLTPEQAYKAAKSHCPDAIVLVRTGDFYEAFREDAKTCARVLDLVLHSRLGMPVVAFLEPQLAVYLGILIKAGHRAAVCDQVA